MIKSIKSIKNRIKNRLHNDFALQISLAFGAEFLAIYALWNIFLAIR